MTTTCILLDVINILKCGVVLLQEGFDTYAVIAEDKNSSIGPWNKLEQVN